MMSDMKQWRFIFTGANDAFFNMALHYFPLPIGAVSQPLKTHNCHSERSEESNSFNKLENRDSSANASE
jgi:hypothetical protein